MDKQTSAPIGASRCARATAFTRRGIAPLVIMAALFGGCAVGQKIPYGTTIPQLQSRGSSALMLAVQDRRPEIVSGSKQPSFCGLLRGGWGNPFDLNTQSGKPLAADFADAIGRGFVDAGYRVLLMPTTPHQTDEQLVWELARRRSERAVLIQIGAWRSDTYVGTALTYHLTARIFDGEGRVLGQAAASGRDELGSSMNSAAHVKRVVPDAYRTIVQRLLGDPAIRVALEAPDMAAPTVAASPVPAVPSGAPVPPPGQ